MIFDRYFGTTTVTDRSSCASSRWSKWSSCACDTYRWSKVPSTTSDSRFLLSGKGNHESRNAG